MCSQQFGGTVNLKYCSAIFCGDDAFDTDEGYQGKMQFLFALVGENGHHATEMDSKIDAQPRSFPQMYGATFIGGGDMNTNSNDAVMKLREGTGGEFANIIMSHGHKNGMYQEKCGTEKRTQTKPAASEKPNYLWWSKNNMMYDSTPATVDHKEFVVDGSKCAKTVGGDAAAVFDAADPKLRLLPVKVTSKMAMIDPRPEKGSPALSKADAVPAGDSFFSDVSYRGAFEEDLWLSGLSWLDSAGKLPMNEWGEALCGELKADKTLMAHKKYTMTCQVFVKSGMTLTIEAGTTITSLADDGKGKAPALVVERGAKIMADGTAAKPITFTSAKPAAVLPQVAAWGGLIVLGNAPVKFKTAGKPNNVEGLPTGDGEYGGTKADDDSGVLRYVRVWYVEHIALCEASHRRQGQPE